MKLHKNTVSCCFLVAIASQSTLEEQKKIKISKFWLPKLLKSMKSFPCWMSLYNVLKFMAPWRWTLKILVVPSIFHLSLLSQNPSVRCQTTINFGFSAATFAISSDFFCMQHREASPALFTFPRKYGKTNSTFAVSPPVNESTQKLCTQQPVLMWHIPYVIFSRLLVLPLAQA